MRILLLTTMMIFASSAFAGLYKWVDDEGNVHYSQKRPLNKQFKKIKAPAPAPVNNTPLYQTDSKQNEANDTTATETAKNNEARAKNCANAKKNLNAYQVYRRIRDKDGNVKVIDDKEREKQIAQAKQAINDFCN
jgi:ABC-type proline/glycine betaine transport system ATPase subunit